MNTKHLIPSSSLSSVISSEKNNNGACFTIKSNATGKEYTYKIQRSEFNHKWYTHIKVETEYQKYKRLGVYFDGKIIKQKSVVETPSAIAIGWVLQHVEREKFEHLDKNIQVMHVGKCLCCGKVLTDSQSIERGLGPICANH